MARPPAASATVMVSTNAPTAPIMPPTGISHMVAMDEVTRPLSVTSRTPNDAPDDTPVTYGSTSGLWMSACMTAPATARPAPTAITARERGILRWKITFPLKSSGSPRVLKISASCSNDSENDIGYAPIVME